MLNKCDQCGKISTSSDKCSNCGFRLPSPTKKELTNQEKRTLDKRAQRRCLIQACFDICLLIVGSFSIPVIILSLFLETITDFSKKTGDVVAGAMLIWLILTIISAAGHFLCVALFGDDADRASDDSGLASSVSPSMYEDHIRTFIDENNTKE